MKNVIGFRDQAAQQPQETPARAQTQQPEQPVKSVVLVRFEGIKKEYHYYNDRFDLSAGDRVFVSGKLAGRPGTVTNVNTHFRICLNDYEKVLARPVLQLAGTFRPVRDKMVSADAAATPDSFAAWVIPPQPPEETPGEIVSGPGWDTPLEEFENGPIADGETMEQALELCYDGAVAYFYKDGPACTALIEGSQRWHRVEFCYDAESDLVTALYCDCIYPPPHLCRHACAALLTLRMLLHQPETAELPGFTAFDRGRFWSMAAAGSAPVTIGN